VNQESTSERQNAVKVSDPGQLFGSNQWIVLFNHKTTFGFVVKTAAMRLGATMHTTEVTATSDTNE